MTVADNAYKLVNDAVVSIRTMNRILEKTSQRKKELKERINNAVNYKERKPIINEIKELNKQRNAFFVDRELVVTQKKI